MADKVLNVKLLLNASGFSTAAKEAGGAVGAFHTALENAVRGGVDPLVARTTAAGAGMAAFQQALRNGATAAQAEQQAAAAASVALSQLDHAQRQTATSGNEAAQASRSFTENLAAINNAVLSVQQGVRIVGQSIEQFIELGREAAQGVDISRVFGGLTGAEGLDGDQLLQELKQVSRGTISEIELMRSANRALLAGGAEIAEELPRLFEIARAAATATGQDTAYVYETLVKGIIKGSPQLIDNAEIYLSLGDAVDEYAASLGKTSDELTSQESIMATLNAVLAEGDDYIQQIGMETGATVDPFQQFNAAAADLKQTLGEDLLPTATRVVEALRDLSTVASGGFGEQLNAVMEGTLRNVESSEEYLGVVQATVNEIDTFQGRLMGLGHAFNSMHQPIFETSRSYEEYLSAMEIANDVASKHNQIIPLLTREAYEASKAAETQAETQRELAEVQDEASRTSEQLTQAQQDLAVIEEQIANEIEAVNEKMRERMADEAIREARRAEDEIVAAMRREEDQARQIARQREDIERNLQQQRAQAQQQYQDAMAQAQAQYQQATEQAARQHAQRRADIERDFRKRLRDIQREYESSALDAARERDALGLVRARQQRDEQIAIAEEERSEQVAQAQRQYQEQLQAADEARKQAEQAAYESLQRQLQQLEENRARQEDELQRSLEREAEDQRIADQRRREDENRARERAEQDRQRWLDRRIQQIRAAHAAELAEVRRYVTQYRAEMARMQTTGGSGGSSRRSGGRDGRRQEGGYASYGVYELGEAGREFVLSASTTRALEAAASGPLTQERVRALGQGEGGRQRITIQDQRTLNFTPGISSADRAWIREAIAAQSTEMMTSALSNVMD